MSIHLILDSKVILKRNTAPEQVQSLCYIPYVLHFNSGHFQPKHSKMNRNKTKNKESNNQTIFVHSSETTIQVPCPKVFFHGAHPNIEQNIGFHHHHCPLPAKKNLKLGMWQLRTSIGSPRNRVISPRFPNCWGILTHHQQGVFFIHHPNVPTLQVGGLNKGCGYHHFLSITPYQ